MVAVDQYGRKWAVTLEIASGSPTSGIQPAGWFDPLRTHQKYLTVPKEQGQPVWGKVVINFEQWVNDQQQAEREWKVRLWDIGQLKNPGGFDASTAEQNEYLVSLAGPKPWPSSVALLEAAAGDPALLGLTPLTKHAREMLNIVAFEDIVGPMRGKAVEPEPEMPKVVPTTPPVKALESTASIGGGGPTTWATFVKETMKAGLAKNTKECAVLWNERKAAMRAAEGEG
jgi:hypothetical protein